MPRLVANLYAWWSGKLTNEEQLMKTLNLFIASLFITAIAAVAQSPAEAPAAPKSSEPNPDLAPISAIGAHVCGIHFYSGNMKRQLI
ncbi:MAG: hypothetical protein DMF46_09265, partial [Verrucomicrobia bacterium]